MRRKVARLHRTRRRSTRGTRRRSNRRVRRRLYGGSVPVSQPPATILNHISNAIYINLDKRPDRRAIIEQQFSMFLPNRLIRIPGQEDAQNPYRGSVKSHIAALKHAIDNQYPNVLILEDDAVWANPQEGYKAFEQLLQKDYDVIMLGGLNVDYEPGTFKVKFAFGAHAYYIKGSYIPVLYDTLVKGLEAFDKLPTTRQSSDVAADAFFPELQKRDKWYIVIPTLVDQGASYSNIVKGQVNYKNVTPTLASVSTISV